MKPAIYFTLLTAVVAPVAAQITETPHTVAPGKFLVEMDAISLSFNREDSGPNKYRALGLATTLLSTGVSHDVDVQVGVQFFLRQSYELFGASTRRSGLGDVTLRSKWTYWRDEKRGMAAAVIPYVKVPTSTGGVGNNHTEGGVIFPWELTLGKDAYFGAMASWDVVRNDDNDGYDSQWFASTYIYQKIVGPISAYAEATLQVSSASASSFTGGIGGGMTWDLSKSLMLDYGVNRGLGNRATDWDHVVRLRWEF